MNQVDVINEQEILGKQFRMYGTPDEPLFLAKDVAEWIGHSNPRVMLQVVDGDEKVVNNVYTLGGEQEAWFLTEDGLYEVLMQSRKPIAKQFKKKVKEILKDVRNHGIYATDNVIDKILNNPEFGIKLLTELKEEREKNKVLTEQNTEMKPKAIFADAVSASNTSILVGDLAKLICQNGVSIGQKRLFQWMRENGWLIKGGASYNSPTQRGVEMGLFEVKESTLQNPDGSVRITRTTKVTGKGQIYFVNKFIKSKSEPTNEQLLLGLK